MDKQYTKDDINDAATSGYVNGITVGMELQKEESKKAYLARLRKAQASKKPLPEKKVQVAKSDKNSLELYDLDKNVGHFETENALAGLTTAKFIADGKKAGWFLERESENSDTKLTYIMPYRIKTHAVSTLLKILQMYKESGNLNGELVTTYTELARSGESKVCHKSQLVIKGDLEALAAATIKGEEIKGGKQIEWAGEEAFLNYVAVEDGIKITLAPRIRQSIEENWSFARIDLNMRKELSTVSQDLHLFLSSWFRQVGQKIGFEKLLAHVFAEGARDIYWQKNRLKKALSELEQKGAFKHKLSKQMSKIGEIETMVSIWK